MILIYETPSLGNSLVVQWLGLRALTAESLGSVPGWGTKILQAIQKNPKNQKTKTTPSFFFFFFNALGLHGHESLDPIILLAFQFWNHVVGERQWPN